MFGGIKKHLLIGFVDDDIDETNVLEAWLREIGIMDLTVLTLPGDHGRPLQSSSIGVPSEWSQAADNAFETGSNFLSTSL